jgi:hypothetical protein
MLKGKVMFKKLQHKWQDSKYILSIFLFSYCKDPKTIILCVVPANQDLSLSDGLKLAR